MDKILDMYVIDWDMILALGNKLLIAFVILLLSYLSGRLLSRFILALFEISRWQNFHKVFFMRLIMGICLFLGFVISLQVLGLQSLALSLLAGGGISAIAIGFAFREIGENFMVGLFLAFSRPFNVGDLIRSEEFEGEVQAVELRYTHLRAADGADMFIPSTQLFSRPITNYTRDGLRQISSSVGIDYSNDALRACELLKGEVQQVSKVLQDPEVNVVISSLDPGYVNLLVMFWVDTFDRQTKPLLVRSAVLDRCRAALLVNGYTVSADTTANIALRGTVDLTNSNE